MNADLLMLCPLDGRYAATCHSLRDCFSEHALIRARAQVEVAWLKALASEPTLKPYCTLEPEDLTALEARVHDLSLDDAQCVKTIEKTTRHDVKAVEYALQQWLDPALTQRVQPWIHFGCTSEDINNLAYALMIERYRHQHAIPMLEQTGHMISHLCETHAHTPMLCRTHGQSASPSTFGKECGVFLARLSEQLIALKQWSMPGKCNGAVGHFNAHHSAFPETDWPALSRRMIQALGLRYQAFSTQIEPHDGLAALCHISARISSIGIDLSRDFWQYISLGYLRLAKHEGQVGSSTMPHKINPIDFENAEGNLGMSQAMMAHFAQKLPVSRLQRDLSDSTVMRNLGVAFGYQYLALHSLQKGLGQLSAHSEAMAEDLSQHWEVLAECIQTHLRKHGHGDAYEILKAHTQGQTLTKAQVHAGIEAMNLAPDLRESLLALEPRTYLGLAPNIAQEAIKAWQTACQSPISMP